MTRAEQTVQARMWEIRELVRSGATEMVGKTYRGASGKIEGRYKGGFSEKAFPELARAGMSPGEAAKVIESKRHGKRWKRLQRAIADEYRLNLKKRGRGRLTVSAHKGMKSCTLCKGMHSTNEHRFHGPGSFHATHAFSFNPRKNPISDPHQEQLKKFKRYLLARGYMVDSLPSSALSDLFKVHSKNKKLWADYIRWEQGPGLYAEGPLFNARRLKKNPCGKNPVIQAKIYGRVLAIEAQKTGKHLCDVECKRFGHRYRHDFKSGAVMYGLSNGDILIRKR